MKRRFIKVAIALVVLLGGIVGISSFYAFHNSNAWIVRSPANPRWAVDVVSSGFTDLGQDFRVHDFLSSPLHPRRICDIYWEDRYYPQELLWSRDGTVVAVAIYFKGQAGTYYGCAYDFLRHQSLYSSSFQGSPLEPFKSFHASVDQLLTSRGGAIGGYSIPDVTKP